MTSTDFQSFSTFFLNQLKIEDKKALDTIERNSKIIKQYLDDANSDYLKKFVNDFNTVVLESKVKKYKIFEKALNHALFGNVLIKFRNSDVLVRACKALNKKAAEWLLTMKLNYNVQDENGATAIMEASFRPSMDFVFEKLLKSNVDINLVDNNGNSVLFYATKNPKSLKTLLNKSNIDINHLNTDNDSVLTYCCRTDRVNALDILINQKSLNPNHANCIGKTAAMYLVENAQYQFLKSFFKTTGVDPNYKNKFEQTLVSCFVKKYYQLCNNEIDNIELNNRSGYLRNKRYARTLETLIDLGCDFNVPVDDDGNTPLMVFLMMKDYVTSQYLLNECGSAIDLSKKNYNGVNASYLSLFISPEVFDNLKFKSTSKFSFNALKKAFTDNPTFDKKYLESSEDITVSETLNIINKYKVNPKNSKIIQQWLFEIYIPEAFKGIEIPGYKYTPEFALMY